MVFTQSDPASENLTLQREIENLKAENQQTWNLLIEIMRRLQASSTSVKAAVTSLLDYDIFWDVSNQHEFLKTIETSSDQALAIEMLLLLDFRLKVGRLELRPEPHSLQEILPKVEANIKNRFPTFEMELSMPMEGKPVLVDYEYLSLTLTLLIHQLISGLRQSEIHIHLQEQVDNWVIKLSGLNPKMVKYVESCLNSSANMDISHEIIDPEDVLRMKVIRKLFDLQGVNTWGEPSRELEDRLDICFPLFYSRK